MPKSFSTLEKNILKSKGVTDAVLKRMTKAGITGRGDFATVGDAATLSELVGLDAAAAGNVMAWALGVPAADGGGKSGGAGGKVVVESADVVYCVHCGTKQPKDYSSGDLCPACGKQAEPVSSCFWCGASGPGKFCRACGAQFVPTGELELAVHLKREGIAKDDIPGKLAKMSAAEKEALWGRVRRGR